LPDVTVGDPGRALPHDLWDSVSRPNANRVVSNFLSIHSIGLHFGSPKNEIFGVDDSRVDA
jgi:hypothetical protein